MATQQLQVNGLRHAPLAKGLGWFSIGLGLAEVAVPERVAALIGVENESGTRALLRFYGLREITAGIGILSGVKPAGWLWSRVAGDALDLSSLGSAIKNGNANRTKLWAATAAVAGVTAADIMCAQAMSQNGREEASSRSQERVTRSIVVNCSPEEAYRFWRNFENLPSFMSHLDSVEVTGDQTSHWTVRTLAGRKVEWDAQTIEDQPNSRIAWRSLPGSDVDNSGSVTFEPATGGRGTVVRVEMRYAPPAGAAGKKLAKLFGKEPGQQVEHDLYAFKQVIETGEVVHSDASIHSGMHPARPPKKFKVAAHA
ncbi:MAG: SRPBCC family protein [Acidobacteriaceae bacterium]|nr:SRPBCC family protein [Acidobacteriaceae bacterium]